MPDGAEGKEEQGKVVRGWREAHGMHGSGMVQRERMGMICFSKQRRMEEGGRAPRVQCKVRRGVPVAHRIAAGVPGLPDGAEG